MGFPKKDKKKLLGFTLIELMVVIAILATIAAVLIPRFVRHRLQLKQAECRQSLTEILEAEHSFYNQHGSYTNDLRQLGWTPKGTPRYLYGFFDAPDDIPHTTADPAIISNCNSPPCYSTQLMTKGEKGPLYGPLTPQDLPHTTHAKDLTFKVGCVAQITNDSRLDQATMDQEGHFEPLIQFYP
ncbi:MAG: hypothetical protein A3F89_08175 [Deltaproteobacteria bacterium RIFCSPLOWO2_12_FULL_50_11]|nr:MAG: hypothetical protein A2053_02565 [Deltaproteobacteria bacterium GWA2_50_8]OGQ66944.1 MAG: hypothetical protein A3F89_08175 [Deltaproteobacteria bacterium RIFCSPLOWO2_12_FULL_50_11]